MNATDQPTFVVPHCPDQVEIIHQDDTFLVVNKPHRLLSVPGRHPANRDCLISRLQQQQPQARIVHRLDMDTSGLMVVALNADSHRQLSRAFEQRAVAKRYTAVVYGEIKHSQLEVDLPLICDWPNRPRQKVDHEQGKKAHTKISVISREQDRSRITLTPITGRSHQLRVHTAEMGHPILGCEFYAHDTARRMAERLLLHASELSFPHPVSGETQHFHCRAPF